MIDTIARLLVTASHSPIDTDSFQWEDCGFSTPAEFYAAVDIATAAGYLTRSGDNLLVLTADGRATCGRSLPRPTMTAVVEAGSVRIVFPKMKTAAV